MNSLVQKVVACLLLVSPPVFAGVVESDVCVYGGTSGGVVAAVAAARLGKSVSLISLNSHVGGMTASGLGVTDIGPGNDLSYLGGISREFYQRVGAAYGSSSPVIWFEPHVAETVFNQMLAGAGVSLYTNGLLASATQVSNRLTQITLADGSVFRAKQFIDTTYEGDLMAAAGVTFTWGREAVTNYNESLAGIRSLGGTYNYDPYVVPGNPASGLLPLVQTNTGGSVGDGDRRLQAFNYRLCLTQNATNKLAITAPTNYSAANYELVRRYVTNRLAVDGSVSLSSLIHIQQIIPNGKTDINANGELSTDYVGYNYTWATNTYAGREVIRAAHENYIRGLLYFYATSPNIPPNLNTEAQSWGLAKDEFTDNGGWPWQIYVREARRMVGAYVMTQSNCESRVIAPDSICLARYNIDSHGVQRLASGNVSRWEGSIGGTPPYPYPISYRSIIPRSNECQNVFCTFALSASHVAFASCRMEPVFMMTSQAAGTAAAFAIDDGVAVQALNYAKLAAQLRADGQLLDWAVVNSLTNGIILDETDLGTSNSGGWTSGANAGGWNGDYLLDGIGVNKPVRWLRYMPSLPTNGTYEVHAWWVESSNRATNTPFDIIHAGGTNRFLVNQRLASGGWFKLMTTNFNVGQGHGVIIRNDGTATNNYVVADGIRFLPVGNAVPPPPPPVIEVVASDAVAGEFQTNPARVTFVRSGDTNPAVTIGFSVTGSAVSGADYLSFPTSLTLSSNQTATNLLVTPLADSLVEGDETVTVTLAGSAAYTRTSLSNATVKLRDRPLDEWRKNHFTLAELGNSAVSGDSATPAGDGVPNLLKYALGLSPKVSQTSPLVAGTADGRFTLTYSRARAASDVRLNFLWSTNLSDWTTNSPLVLLSSADQVTNELITLRGTNAATAGFIKAKAEKL
ncbi:MAG: FAD-dependent oxidoreductase [Verrucomicrobiota bacterium]